MKVSTIIPCFKSPLSLKKLVREISDVLRNSTRISEFEILLVVDDGLLETWSLVKEICRENSSVVGLRLSRNFGQHQALFAGIAHSRFEFILTLDDDSQHRPSEIEKLFDTMESDTDIVYGIAKVEEHHFLRNAASRMSKSIFENVFGLHYATKFSAFRFFRSSIFGDANLQYELGTSLDVFLVQRTNRVRAVIVYMEKRAEGKSNYSLRRLLKYALGIVVSSSRVPLGIMSWIGFTGCVVALISGARVFYNWVSFQTAVPGYTSLFLIMTFFGSINLLSIGIMAEYLGSIHGKVSKNPSFVVSERFKS